MNVTSNWEFKHLVVFCEKMVVTTADNHVRKKPYCKTRWISAIFVQKTICWPNLGCALWRAVCCYCSCIQSEADKGSSCSAMTQHYPTISTAAAVWASRLPYPVSAMLLIYTYSLLPARVLSTTMLFASYLIVADARQRSLWKFYTYVLKMLPLK